MVKDKSGLKDKVVGALKEAEGKVTGDKLREAEGKAQKAKGKVKDKINDAKEEIERRKEEGVT
ncbi:CsbD family protein [Lactobacillus hamsteri]|nr:CsbD family protein [Lactobacillus hamsteri]